MCGRSFISNSILKQQNHSPEINFHCRTAKTRFSASSLLSTFSSNSSKVYLNFQKISCLYLEDEFPVFLRIQAFPDCTNITFYFFFLILLTIISLKQKTIPPSVFTFYCSITVILVSCGILIEKHKITIGDNDNKKRRKRTNNNNDK